MLAVRTNGVAESDSTSLLQKSRETGRGGVRNDERVLFLNKRTKLARRRKGSVRNNSRGLFLNSERSLREEGGGGGGGRSEIGRFVRKSVEQVPEG
jgi:hypothetical protein